ncbi:Gfo/Idh/MocA family protein [Enterococcus sp. AZ103]|uniref:Gfo/Idh/MocA family protein n=1 Tax=Enterococcus sp. AZ103 TaxID=2774628 RepID=UPI003F21E2C7
MKLAIVGSGMIVHTFLEMAQELPNTELVALVGRAASLEKLEKMKADNNIQKIYTDYGESLKDPEIDTVYVALPNNMHFQTAKEALIAGKNVICEKPFTLTLAEFLELKDLAAEKDLVLVEAITNQYLENYQAIKDSIKDLGDLKIIESNYSQYSSRYDRFKQGEILPAFDPNMGGGALMDLNIYNIHFVAGILGRPEKVEYLANVERDIDTSGILLLDYGETKAVCIGAKDSSGKISSMVQGTKGYVRVEGATNTVPEVEIAGEIQNFNTHQHRMFNEFVAFEKMIREHDMTEVNKQLAHSEIVMEILQAAKDSI